MKYAPKKHIWLCTSALLGGTILSIFTAVSVLRNLGGLVGALVESNADAAFDFARIFEQTKTAQIAPHWLLPLLLFGIYAFAVWRFSKKHKPSALRVILWSVLFILLLAVSFAFSLMLTRVNGIRFCDLLAELLPIIDKL